MFFCLKVFFAAIGVPKLIIRDNDSQFISNETQLFVNTRGTKRQFNLPVPFGGVVCLNGWYYPSKGVWKLLGQFRIDYEQSHTLLVEMRAVINNRPLTFIYGEPEEENLENISNLNSSL